MHDRTKRVAVVTSRFPFPLERGDKLRAYHQIRSLSAHMRIALIAIVESEIQESWIQELSPYCESIDLVHKPKLASVPSLALASLRGEPMQVGYFKTRRVRREVAELVAARDPDFLYCQLIRTAFAAGDSKGRTTIDFQDSMSAATHRRSKLARFGVQQLLELESRRLAKYERKAYAWFDNQVIISEQDRDTFEFPEAKGIDVLGNGVDTKFFCPRPGVKKGFDVGFIGNLGYPPNVAAVDLLVREVMPRIQSERGDATCLLAGARPEGWSVEDQIAFWCNSYNAVVAYHVLDRYPDVESVKKVSGFFDELEFPVAGREMTLDELETEARSLGDPRVHFAVVCASTSCPDLQPSPFEGPMLEHQLESATLEFLDNDEKGMRFEPSKNTLHLSSIFKWYAGDFTGGSTAVAFFARGKVLEWVTQHLPEDLAAEVQKEDPGISYLDYDWSLNDRPKADS